jgi:hypothetical protein
MQKKTIIVLSLISAILSLVYLLLNYYGLSRYMTMYWYSVESFFKGYNNLDKIGNNKIIVSIYAIPDKMNHLNKVLKSILDQTVKVDMISITVPEDVQYVLPDELKDYITLHTCNKDNGTLNSITSTINMETESTTNIITLASDTIYGKDFIESLMDEVEKNPDKIVYVKNDENGTIDIKKGSVFSVGFFGVDFLEIPKSVNGDEWLNDYFKDFEKVSIVYSGNYKII